MFWVPTEADPSHVLLVFRFLFRCWACQLFNMQWHAMLLFGLVRQQSEAGVTVQPETARLPITLVRHTLWLRAVTVSLLVSVLRSLCFPPSKVRAI